jgi:conserved oligomeric Golgi complex subunit 7
MASKLVSMQQSLRILANASDVETKQLQLEGLKNRLEAKASPSLVQAFTTESLGTKYCVLKQPEL